MKTFEFVRETLSDTPGWEMDLYKSKDLNGVWSTERACLEAVVLDQYLIDPDVAKLLIETELDRLLIENGVYVVFLEE